MRPIIAALRAVVAAGLIVGLGFAGFGACPGAADLPPTAFDCASHRAHHCACMAISGHCYCGSKCHCGSRSPQQGTLPVVPSRAHELTQYFVVTLVDSVAGESTAWPSTTHFSQACLADCASTLIAQGTRLNI